jgi:two-component system response regulator (stage 0 sporulation protein F)
MKIAMKWDVGKRANSCRTSSALQPDGETRPVIHRESPRAAHNVLVIDDDPNLTRLMATILRTSGIDAVTATDGYTALDVVEHNDLDAIVLDLQMPQMDGRGFFRELRARGIDTPVLIASAYGARDAQKELGAEASVEKPFDPETLISELERIFTE